MKRFIATLTVWIWGTVCVAYAAPDEEAAVTTVIQEVLTAAKNGNANALTKYYLPDVTGFSLGGQLLTKALDTQGFTYWYAAGYKSNFHITHLDVTVYDNTALAMGYMGGTISFPGETGQELTLEGPWRVSWVLRKQGGAWKIAHYHESSLTPTPAQPVAVHFPEAAVNGLYRPTGQEPFPAVVLLHGCGGVGDQQDRWAKTLQTWGYVALITDSFDPRGVEQTCAEQLRISNSQRVLDAYAALRYLQNQPLGIPSG